jgi:Fe-S cluster biogenesis protein NfuA
MHVCPNCGAPVKITHVDVTVEGNVKYITYEGACENCSSAYRLIHKDYLKRQH